MRLTEPEDRDAVAEHPLPTHADRIRCAAQTQWVRGARTGRYGFDAPEGGRPPSNSEAISPRHDTVSRSRSSPRAIGRVTT